MRLTDSRRQDQGRRGAGGFPARGAGSKGTLKPTVPKLYRYLKLFNIRMSNSMVEITYNFFFFYVFPFNNKRTLWEALVEGPTLNNLYAKWEYLPSMARKAYHARLRTAS